MKRNIISEKSYAFFVRIVNLYKYISSTHNEFVLSKQILRCGTSIGANVSEAQYAQSRADFHTKLNIALKEANETKYWLSLLHDTHYIDTQQYESLNRDISVIFGLLMTICKATQK